MFTQDNGLKDDISPFLLQQKHVNHTFDCKMLLHDFDWQTTRVGGGAHLLNSGLVSAPYRPRQTLNQLQKWEQTNKIYADNSAILICYPQLEQVFQQYLSQSVFLCWEENKKVSKQISLYLFNNFFLYVYIKGSFQEK